MMNLKTFRLGLLMPISIVCNCLFLVVTVIDFHSLFRGEKLVRFTRVQPSQTPLLFSSFLTFGLVLVVDTVFILLALYKEGKKKLPVVGGSLIHHIGILIWVGMIVSGAFPYNIGVAYCLLLLEFCFPLRALVNFIYRNEPTTLPVSGEVSPKIQWSFKVFMLDMFMSGGGTFSALLIYVVVLSDKTVDAATKSEFLYMYLFCILYWFVQLGTFHRASLNRLVGNAIHQACEPFKETMHDIEMDARSEVTETNDVDVSKTTA